MLTYNEYEHYNLELQIYDGLTLQCTISMMVSCVRYAV